MDNASKPNSSASPGPWRWGWYDDTSLIDEGLLYTEGRDYLGFERDNSSTDADATLIASAPDMLALLRELEWADTGERGFSESDKPDTRCPVCHEYGYDGHSPDCRLNALLRSLP